MNIEDFAKIPYLENGRTAQGADCYGLVILYFRHLLGIEVADFPGANISPEANSTKFLENAHLEWVPVPTEQCRQHDAVLLIGEKGKPNHVGVMIDKYRLIQLSEKHGCSIIRLSRVSASIHAIYRYRELA